MLKGTGGNGGEEGGSFTDFSKKSYITKGTIELNV